MMLVGGPLDGEEVSIADDSTKPFVVFECAKEDDNQVTRPGLFALYKLEKGRLLFMETKTLSSLLKE